MAAWFPFSISGSPKEPAASGSSSSSLAGAAASSNTPAPPPLPRSPSNEVFHLDAYQGRSDLTHWERVRVQWLSSKAGRPAISASTAKKPRSTDFGNILEPMKGIAPTPMHMPRFMVQLVAHWRKEGVFDPPAPTD